MNGKFILKLTIVLMLVLVLIPVVAAEDFSESFYIEYADESSEDVIVDYSYSIEEVDHAFEETSLDIKIDEVEPVEEISTHEDYHSVELIEEGYDDIVIEHVESSYEETHDIFPENPDINYISNENFADICDEDINENEDDLTYIEKIHINHVSLFNSKHDYNANCVLINELFLGTTNSETSDFKRSLSKILELKNDILINLDIEMISDELIEIVNSDIIVSINKISTNFIFSIDNSVFADGYMIPVNNSSFLKFNSFFNAFSFDSLTFEHFFSLQKYNSLHISIIFCTHFSLINEVKI